MSSNDSIRSSQTSTLALFEDAQMNLPKEPKHSMAFVESQSHISCPPYETDTTSSHHELHLKKHDDQPPSLFLDFTNFCSTQPSDDSPVIETVGPESPPFMSQISLERPSEEEIKRRTHEKVMRTLGEHIPIELVSRGAKIPNVTVFPDPPCPIASETTRETGPRLKLFSQRNFTLATLPHISAITTTLTSHTWSKYPAKLETRSTIPTPHLLSRQNRPSDTIIPTKSMDLLTPHPRPLSATVFSSIVFATTTDRPWSSFIDDEIENLVGSMAITDEEEEERSAKLTRSSLSTATQLQTSPLHDVSRELTATSPAPPSRRYEGKPPNDGQPIIKPPPRRESLVLFAPGTGFSHDMNNADTNGSGITEDKSDEDGDNDQPTSASRIYTQRKISTQLESGTSFSSPSSLHPEFVSWPHVPLHVRPEKPFHANRVPIGDQSGRLVPVSEWTSRGKDLIHRKEVSQGWSGEWNQRDMQDVIRKLRSLK